MKKLIYDSDFNDDFLTSAGGSLVRLIETSSHIKSASSSVISREMLESCKPDSDHFLMHVIALGDFERYGANRNADAFSKEACVKYHDTFVKNGSFYREHRHHSKDESIGVVKASAFNEEMGRIELAIWGHKKKAAEEWEIAKSGKPLSYSMSCSLPFDVCNACGHKAKSDFDRCDHIKYAKNQYIPEFKKYAFMWNPDPKFFDISRVAKPADRIAHHIFIDLNLQKAASASGISIRSSDYARVGGVYIPGENHKGCLDTTKAVILKKLAAAEKKFNEVVTNNIRTNSPEVIYIQNLAKFAFDGEGLNDNQLSKLSSLRPDTFFHELAKRACILPFAEFMSYCLSMPKVEVLDSMSYKYAMKKEIPCCLQAMEDEEPDLDLEDVFDAGSRIGSEIDPANTDEVQDIMDMASNHFSVKPEAVNSRSIRISISKSASANNKEFDISGISEEEKTTARRMARAYGFYKIAAVKTINDNFNIDMEQLAFILASQNI